MIRVRLVSDLHFEFHADQGREFAESMDPTGVDVLVVAGDLTNEGAGLERSLGWLADRFPRVVYVHGNHEFYDSSRARTLAATARAVARSRNLAWLDCAAVEIGGVRFLGAPLWFREDPRAPRAALHDFAVIERFESWVYEENSRALEWLQRELRAGDVVVTHHLPHPRSIDPRYVGSPLNPFFLCDVSELIAAREPAAWLHGHTHASVDYQVGATRIVCNPFGYAGLEENPGFAPAAILELWPP